MRHRSFLFIGKMLPYYKLVRALTFPSMPRILVMLFTVVSVGCMLSFTLADPTSDSAARGLAFGLLVFFLPAISINILSSKLILRGDPLFYLRRCLALSLFSCIAWITIILVGGVAMRGLAISDFPRFPFYLALFTVMPLRTLAVFSMSTKNSINKIVFSFLEPVVSVFASSAFLGLDPHYLLVSVPTVGLLSTAPLLVLLNSIESKGREVIRASPLRVFRAFLLDWLNRRNEMFEQFLEEIGTEDDINLTVIKFSSKKTGRPKGVFVVSDFHPGPFLNVGSSMLPFLIQKSFEEDGLLVAVPHGVSGHEHNLVSQHQNFKVISTVGILLEKSGTEASGSVFQRFEVGSAKAGAQVLGECLFLTLTHSPNDMEDIPSQLGKELENLARRRFKDAAIVDSHNCIAEARMFTEKEINDLRAAASQAIESCRQIKTANLEMGAARGAIDGFGPEHGNGPGGARIFVFRTSGQLTAYVVVDANNMAPGLREKILLSLENAGVRGGEVMTTDTHAVNGLVPARLGYHPFGEAIGQEVIIDSVMKAYRQAVENLEEVTVSSSSGSVRVKSLGSGPLEELVSFMYQTAKLVAVYMLTLFLGSNLVGLLVLS
ncbi:DUF2070 family protein [Candidatus Bathyarchaeota archaeon]|nr:DUF2070 family protein [Candidatus Bathyarchaeota archaeon]